MQEAEERMSLEIRKTSVILSYLRYCNVWVFSSLFFIVRTFGFCLFQRLMRRQICIKQKKKRSEYKYRLKITNLSNLEYVENQKGKKSRKEVRTIWSAIHRFVHIRSVYLLTIIILTILQNMIEHSSRQPK